MSKTPPNLVDLPSDVQAYVAAQVAELARKDAAILGLSLSHAKASGSGSHIYERRSGG